MNPIRVVTLLATVALLSGCHSAQPLSPGIASVATGATYTLIRAGSGKCLDVNGAATADGTKIQQWTCNGSVAQQFRVDALSGGNVRLVNPNSGKCVDISGAGTSNGTNVQLWTCNGTAAQSFVIQDEGGGYSRLENPHSGKCVDVLGGASTDGTGVVLWTCDTHSAQKWQLTPVSSTGGGGGNPTELAPYFYTWGWGSSDYAFSSLVDMKSQGGPAEVTIGFVLAGNGCAASTDIQDNLSDVQAFQAAGGHVKASFGGQLGTYLEYNCSSASALAQAIGNFVDATGITDLDFDIEQGTQSSNSKINTMRASALKMVQASRGIKVAFTLSVDPNGLDAPSLAVLQAALSAGVQISYVNVMTMDYGDGTDLATVPIQSVDGTVAQLQSLIPGLSSAAAYRMMGATAMIGQNDDDEVFSPTNAITLVNYAKEKQLGLLAFWAIQRDEKCRGGYNVDSCSGSNSSTFQFSNIFAGVNQ
jgi:hypothetical protein